ncbi:nucleoside/nucleotide kinase family protein [Ruegeria sp. 2205SS24-7]|uniref:nucleoside/nucleotide kinase family protein n=1 Tax=Ruegeria discodermiae TaxID=3064389 RepID=UPI00274231B3|nr:nucleoside/nucleotide kinase family protein [Ruegeria sp. 2205SS24-7]MDP5219104.1 nucleoside/nucleotide kinase family protein [Ruegeria sp. 2205SS24-7]
MALDPPVATLVESILAAPRAGRRRLVALAGAPASGKSTLADALAERLTISGCDTQVVPMDGFHLHNPTLIARGLLDRKGAPETFDVSGFAHLTTRLQEEDEVFYPTFDRARDIAIAGGGLVGAHCDTVIIEGNYLLYDAPQWRDLHRVWDFSVRLEVPLPILEERLVKRWLDHGLSHEDATARATRNDIANARSIAAAMLPADVTVRTG